MVSHSMGGRLGGMKALIVDDNRTTGNFMVRCLTSDGVETRIVRNGYQAMHLLNHDPSIDVTVIDLMMPRISGFELIEWIRTASPRKDLPVVICSSLRDIDTMRKAASLGCRQYLAKPVRKRQLYEKVWAAISGASVQAT